MKSEIISRIEQWSKQTPDQIAICAGSKSITYRELIDLSKKLSIYISENQLDKTGFIGVLLTQCYELPIYLLAIWMAGAAYVPLDPIYPRNRILDIMNAVDPACIITNSYYKERLSIESSNIHLIDIETISKATISSAPFKSRDEAYLIFTSGSTGKPKGVTVTPNSLMNLLQTFERELNITPEDRFYSITPISFDIFGLELFLPLISGATCYLIDRSTILDANGLLEDLRKQKITIFQATPPTYHILIDENWPTMSLRHLLCGGEPWGTSLSSALHKKMPAGCTLWNVYGPTETTIWSSLHKVLPDEAPYLTPSVDHTFFFVLDENQKFAEEGELYIGGAGVSNGYYGNDILTKEQFIDYPINLQFQRLYKTGDMVRRLKENKFQFIGRLDQQVKIRGFRVELGDIEHALLKHPSVLSVAVLYEYVKHTHEKSLVACIQSKKNEHTDYRKFLSEYLPTYMIPQYFIPFKKLPLTPNKKIDRKKTLEELRVALK
jgi:amino acid adenylation domain-containing protein